MTVGARQLAWRRLEPRRPQLGDRPLRVHARLRRRRGARRRRPTPAATRASRSSELRRAANPLGLREPRVYFGERPGADPPYVVLNTAAREVDAPVAGDRGPEYHYDGPGGIALSTCCGGPRSRRVSATSTCCSPRRSRPARGSSCTGARATACGRWRRSCAGTAAPDRGRRRPDPVPLRRLHDERHATPTRRPCGMGGDEVNYVRAAPRGGRRVQRPRPHVRRRRPDPILRAWQAAYPGLFLPAERMPAGCARSCATRERAVRGAGRRVRELPRRRRRPRSGTARTRGRARASSPGRSSRWARSGSPATRRGERGMARAALPARRRLPGDAERALRARPCRSPRTVARTSSAISPARSTPRAGRELTLLSLPRDRLRSARRRPPAASCRARAWCGGSSCSTASPATSASTRSAGRRWARRGSCRSAARSSTSSRVYLTAGGAGVPRLQLVTVLVNGRVGYGRDARRGPAPRALRAGRGGARESDGRWRRSAIRMSMATTQNTSANASRV